MPSRISQLQASGLEPVLDILTMPRPHHMGAGPYIRVGADPLSARPPRRRRYLDRMRRRDLLTQVLLVNLLLVVVAVVTAVIAANANAALLDPQSAIVLGLAVALTIVFNVLLIQRRFQPLEQLVDQMERADLSRPGANLSDGAEPDGPEEVVRLPQAFARMLERLEAERRRASSAALTAQE